MPHELMRPAARQTLTDPIPFNLNDMVFNPRHRKNEGTAGSEAGSAEAIAYTGDLGAPSTSSSIMHGGQDNVPRYKQSQTPTRASSRSLLSTSGSTVTLVPQYESRAPSWPFVMFLPTPESVLSAPPVYYFDAEARLQDDVHSLGKEGLSS